ncbi:MAG TPA: molybdenum cofactor guanylyltransferase [Thermodesulforhabdus norvegica]|uniref:Probable molybdenum cofactor guanylyltransferase n=1 Tax=Thermodesulforhabdus norvegica TaxID=39841 RepID=A0A7C1B144_9BACT|nr:molybdenum cofactor guanylyltransferase [Deltaproteobacteria bacterium]MBW2069097.1 molybdenum cofactor guanylyltransferase [Deltaproteobacteria bacterium]HDL89741.1 molybdenum cofactor guanylyltransferase [Thermodesulforhabdus norvegica]
MIPDLTGVVLAGGASRRFGRNKAMEVVEGERLIDRNVRILRDFCNRIFVVTNAPQDYLGVKANLVRDFQPNQGPLMGLYTALVYAPSSWVFVRAVDMPYLVPELARAMIGIAANGSRYDAIVPVTGKGYEPLCALYNRRCVRAIVSVFQRGERRVASFFRRVNVRFIEETEWRRFDSEGKSFININTPQDYNRLSDETSRSC